MPANPPTRGELGPDIVHSADGFLESLVPNPRPMTQICARFIDTERYNAHCNLRCQKNKNHKSQD